MRERNLEETGMYAYDKANRQARKQIAIMHTINEATGQTKSTKATKKAGRKT